MRSVSFICVTVESIASRERRCAQSRMSAQCEARDQEPDAAQASVVSDHAGCGVRCGDLWSRCCRSVKAQAVRRWIRFAAWAATNIILESAKPQDERRSSSSSQQTFLSVYGLTYEDHDHITLLPNVVRTVPAKLLLI